ncbi:MAG: elongation factor P [Halobacteriovoraceae bacterium]|nr:elongation factor P [Halobacteriovoraceae bacterium]|tara:strand:+ start:119463 stop:120032 length:570 start_codon:yes stop_codon:yes gene_type:complete
MKYQTTDFRNGLKIEIEGKPFIVVNFAHVNPGKGSAFVKAKIKNLETGQVLERTFKAGVDTVDVPNMDDREMEYTYSDMDGYNFMDTKTFESVHLSHDHVGDAKYYLQDGIKVAILYFNERPISIDLPNFVELVVKETDPGLKGDTAQGGTKKAIMDTGLQVSVPLFIEEGEKLKIDTRTGEYVERVKS